MGAEGLGGAWLAMLSSHCACAVFRLRPCLGWRFPLPEGHALGF